MTLPADPGGQRAEGWLLFPTVGVRVGKGGLPTGRFGDFLKEPPESEISGVTESPVRVRGTLGTAPGPCGRGSVGSAGSPGRARVLPQRWARGLTVVLVEAGVQQPVAVGVTRQEVHGAAVGSVAPQHRIPLKTRRSIRSRGARAAAAGSEGPRDLRRACVVSAASSVRAVLRVRVRVCATSQRRAPDAILGSRWQGLAERVHKGRGRASRGEAAEGAGYPALTQAGQNL